jgi:hypothetical protein
VSHAADPEIVRAYREELGPGERSVLWSWIGFTGTFAAVRGITHAIRRGGGPFRDVSVGGVHLHHYMWGIGLLSGSARSRWPAMTATGGTRWSA